VRVGSFRAVDHGAKGLEIELRSPVAVELDHVSVVVCLLFRQILVVGLVGESGRDGLQRDPAKALSLIGAALEDVIPASSDTIAIVPLGDCGEMPVALGLLILLPQPIEGGVDRLRLVERDL
jgi:hypothetical protein